MRTYLSDGNIRKHGLVFCLLAVVLYAATALLSQSSITLSPAVAPSSIQPGTIQGSLTGNGFPSGSIAANALTITLIPVTPGSGPKIAFSPTSIMTLAGSSRRVLFQIPAAGSLRPNNAKVGESVSVKIFDASASLVAGTTQISFGAGISVGGAPSGGFGPLVVINPQNATAQVSVDANAVPGLRTATLKNGSQESALPDRFIVVGGDPDAILTGIGISLTSPVAYRASLSGNSSGGTSFSSSNAASLTVLPPPLVVSALTGAGTAGQSMNVALTGQYVNYIQGSTKASFGAGISVGGAPSGTFGPVTVTSTTTATAQIVINAAADLGPRSVAVATGIQAATLPNGFSVTSVNHAPSVNAGPDQTITLPNAATLSGLVSDDGLPIVGSLTIGWSKVSGPGAVTFASPTSAATSATFGQAGTYVLRLTASDSLLSSVDEVTITVNLGVAPTLLSASPNTGQQGQAHLNVTITGQFTNFSQGITQVSFGDGITVNSLAVVSATSLTANISIGANAVLGARTPTVTFGAQIVSLFNGFSVTDAAIPVPRVIGLTSAAASRAIGDAGLVVGNVTSRDEPTSLSFNSLPSAQGWRYESTSNSGNTVPESRVFSISGGLLIQDSIGTGFSGSGGNVYRFDNIVHPILPFSVEFRARVVNEEGATLTNSSGFFFQVSTGTECFGISLGRNRIVGCGHEELSRSIDNTQFHDYRLEGEPGVGYRVYVDNVLIANSKSRSLIFPNTVYFGDGTGGTNARAEIASFSFRQGRVIVQSPVGGVLVPPSSVVDYTLSTRPNGPPIVGAGPDSSIAFPNSGLQLAGSVMDDGRPAGNALTTGWTRVSGPGTVSFSSPQMVATLATFSAPGSYVLALEASDGEFESRDEITVHTGSGGNQPPTVSAGPDQVITLPASAGLNGTAANDARPQGAILTVSWSRVSGPGAVAFADPGSLATTASFSLPGTYVLRLSASDSELVSFDDVKITVNQVGSVPALVSVFPKAARAGDQLWITILGELTNFVTGVSQVNLGQGITVLETPFAPHPHLLTGRISVASSAALGLRNLTVTTGAEVVTLVDALNVQLTSPGLLSVVPNTASPGQVLNVSIAGQFTNFVQGASQIILGAGISVGAVNVSSPTSVSAQIRIAPDAATGVRTISVVTGLEQVSLANSFSVIASGSEITSVSPNTARQGQNLLVNIGGNVTNFVQGASTANFGAGITVNSVTVSSPTSLTAQITIAVNAALGARTVTVTTGTEVASLTNGFTVTAANQPPVITSQPPNVRNWIKQTPSGTAPEPRATAYNNSSVYDPANDRLIFFSGEVVSGGTPGGWEAPPDVWVLANASAANGPSSWQQLSLPAGPQGRFEHVIAYSQTTNRLIIQGGGKRGAFVSFADTWVLTNANGLGGSAEWLRLPDLPSFRVQSAAAYDEAGNRLIVFAGLLANGTHTNDVWVLRDANGMGNPAWIQLLPTGTPPVPRHIAATAYDPSSNRLIVFGGFARDIPNAFNDLWVLTNANGLGGTPQWIRLTPGNSPGQAYGGNLLYDPVGNQAILHWGGVGCVSLQGCNANPDRVWVLSNANGLGGVPQWTLLNTVGGPPTVRFLSAGAYSKATDRMIVSMGRVGPNTNIFSNEVWVLTEPSPGAFEGQTFAYSVTSTDSDIGDNPTYSLSSAPAGMTINSSTGAIQWTPNSSQLGTHAITARVQDALGASASQSFSVIVHRLNQEPIVEAGANATVILPGSASLLGVVHDDGRPAINLSQTWSKLSGPGTVTFANASSAQTTATFGSAGTYVLRLTANDTQLSGSDDVTVVVNSGAPAIISLSPNSGQQGQANLPIRIDGQFTSFLQGTTQVSFGAGVTVNSVTVSSATSLTAQVSIAANAMVGARTTTVTTGPEAVSLAGAFIVNSGTPGLTSVNPNSARVGERIGVDLTGSFTNFAQGVTTGEFGQGVSLNGAGFGNVGVLDVLSPSSARVAACVRAPTPSQWVRLAPVGQGPPGNPTTSVLDPGTNRMIVFGGTTSIFDVFTNRVLVLDQATGNTGNPAWTEILPSGVLPSPRIYHSVVYSERTNRLIVFGGLERLVPQTFAAPDVWVLTNANGLGGSSVWLRLSVTGGPPTQGAEAGLSTVYDPVSNRMIIYGGCPRNSGCGAGTSDVWVLTNADGIGGLSEWIKLNPTGPTPLGRNSHAAAYDEVNNRLILFGGDPKFGGSISWIDDTWVLTNANGLGGMPAWTQIASGGPPARNNHSVVFDSHTNRLVLFGGRVGPQHNVVNDVWVLNNANGLGGSSVWTKLVPSGDEPEVGEPGGFQLQYDRCSNRAIAFNGQGAFSLSVVDTGASVGARTVTVRTGIETVSLNPGFQILPGLPFLGAPMPSKGAQGQTRTLTLTGVNTTFLPGSTTASLGPGISVGGSAPGAFGPVSIVTPTVGTISVTIEPGASIGGRDLTVNYGSQTLSIGGAFSVDNLAPPVQPRLISVSPTTGLQGQSLTLLLDGADTSFSAGTTTVSLGTGVSVSAVRIVSAARLEADIVISALATVGPRNLTVQTGSQTVILNGGFTVIGAPAILSVSPSLGLSGGSVAAVITGQFTNFIQGTSQVSFGAGITVNSVTVTSTTSLTAQLSIAANATVGPRTVTITTGTEIVSLASGFTVSPGAPIITSIVPTGGQQGQSISVAITGQFTNWVQGTTQASFGAGISATSISVNSPTSLTAQIAIAASAAVGARTISVTTGAEVVSVLNVFNVTAGTPALQSISPNTGQQGQSLPITITGQFTNFVQGTSQIGFGTGITVSQVTVANTTSLTAQISIASTAALGVRTVTVTTGAEVASLVNGFSVTGGPFVSSLNPGGAQQGQTLSVEVIGQSTNFVQGTSAVTFGAGITVNSVTVATTTSLSAQITVAPSAAVGPRTVTVTTGAEVASFPDGFSVVAATISLTTVNPGGGQQGQSLPVTITGQFTNFVQGTTTVSLGARITVSSVAVASATSLTAQIAIASTAAVGPRIITVTTGTEIASAADAFDVVAGAPVLLSAAPNSGARGQSLAVTITGQFTNFAQGQTVVSLGAGITVNSVSVASLTSLTAQISIASDAALGARLAAATTGTEVASLANAFSVTSATNQSPSITIAPTWSVTLPNRLTLTYTVSDDGLPSGGALTTTWTIVSGPGTAGFTDQTLTSISAGFSQAGTYVLRIEATDTQFTVSQNVTVTVSGTPTPAPTVSISSPIEGTDITTFTNVVGTADSPILASWTLEFRMIEENSYRTFASGTTPVLNGVLGQFDPTLLINGIAQIRLRAIDTNGASSVTEPVNVVLTKNQKIGNFTVSFKDLEVPLSGIGIQVIRTYDSRNLAAGDFGAGWTLDIRNVRLRDNGAVGLNWQGTRTGSGLGTTYCIVPTKNHVITAILSDGTVYKFEPTVTPQCQGLVPILEATVGFRQLSGPTATLSLTGSNTVVIESAWPGPIELLDDDFFPVDFNRYRLTLADGRTLTISRSFGLETLSDLNSNTLTITANAITHSSGRSITFSRDTLGRITTITDPSGGTLRYAYNVSGDLVSFTDQVSNVSTYTYDANHRLLRIADPRGIEPIRNEYDSSGRLIRSLDASGNPINYTHDFANHRETVTDRLGHQTINEYDADGNVVRVTDALLGVTQRTYDNRGNMLTETNALGKTRTYVYDANDNRLSETDPVGGITRYTYSGLNKVLTITDPLGRVTTNTYNANGNLLTTRDPLGNTTTYTYDSLGNQTSMTDPLGGQTSYSYNLFGHLLSQTDPLGNVTTYTIDASGRRLTETRTRTTPAGAETLLTQYTYDAAGRLTRTTYPDGSTTQTAYNSIGKQSTTTDQLSRQTTYTYDDLGRLTQTTFPDGTTERSGYDAEGRRTSSIDRANRTMAYTYDGLGRLTRTTFFDGASNSTVYDAIGQVTQATDARGNMTRYAYDDAGRRTSVTNALNQVTAFAYDAAGNQTSMTDARSDVTQYQYDANNRRTRVTYQDGTFDTIAYDALSRTISKTDQAGRTTQYQYDRLGRLTQVTDALSQATTYAYDAVGNRITQTDALGRVTRFEYDRLGRRTRRTLPLGMSETFVYDAAGNQSSKTDFNGRTTTYTYDTVNRMLRKTPDASLGEPVVVYAYTATGQRASMTDASGTTTYTYDSRDRLLTKATPQGTLTYTYDLAGNLATVRSSNTGGTSVDYSYDVLNRLSRVTDNRLASGVTTYSYDAAGNLANYLYPNGVQHTYSYNALNRLTSLSVASGATALAGYAYTLGAAGNRTTLVELGGRTVDYAYDALYRLTTETIAGATINGTIGYTYDVVGNRLARTSTVAPVPAATYSYDANDRMGSDTHDNNGNTTGSAGATYTYDFENRLRTKNGTEVGVVYDGDGARVAKSAGGVTTRYLVDERNLTGYSQVFEEIVSGTVQRVYTYGLHRISQSRASGTTFYGHDGHGSVRLLTDLAGTVTDRYDYDAFGVPIQTTGTTPNDYLYAGEQADSSLGMVYLRARYLLSQTGRFWTIDPVEGFPYEPATLHRYQYAANNPTDNKDPSGETTITGTLNEQLLVGGLIGTLVALQHQELQLANPLRNVLATVKERTEPRRHGGRLQVQGPDLVRRFGTDTISWPWSRTSPLPAVEALGGLASLQAQLNRRQFAIRSEAFADAARFIEGARPGGVGPLDRSFRNRSVRIVGGSERVDVVVETGIAFVN